MVYKRRTMRKRPMRRRPVARARRRLDRRYTGLALAKARKAPGQVPHYFTRRTDQMWNIALWDDTTSSWSATGGTSAALTVKANNERNYWLFGTRFDDLPNDSEFSALFRYYKLLGCRLSLVFRNNVSDQGGSNMLPIVMHSWAPDMNESDAPTTTQQLRERGNLKIRYVNSKTRKVDIFFKPKILTRSVDIDGNLYHALGSSRPAWQSMNAKNLVHSGIFIAIDNSSGVQYTVDLEAKFYFACKGTQ